MLSQRSQRRTLYFTETAYIAMSSVKLERIIEIPVDSAQTKHVNS